MIACTLYSPAFESLALEAIERVKFFSGLHVEAVRIDCDGKAALRAKVELMKYIGRDEQVMFFDPDWWMLRPCPVAETFGESSWLIGVEDVQARVPGSEINQLCKRYGVKVSNFINGGWWISDFRKSAHQELWLAAAEFMDENPEANDQTAMNVAALQVGMPQIYTVPDMWNRHGKPLCHSAYAAHAAGIGDKLGWLRHYAEITNASARQVVWFNHLRTLDLQPHVIPVGEPCGPGCSCYSEPREEPSA